MNSNTEKAYVELNGVRQGMFIEGADLKKPVLLYLHGGMPEHFLSARYPTGLDDYFTVVWWDRRGSGLSYSPTIAAHTMTVEQMIEDTLAITNYLRDRFEQEQIYMMGHSGGTFFAIQAAARAPRLYCTYIAIAQMSFQLKSEQLAYAYMLTRFRETGDVKMVRRLERAPVASSVPLPAAYMKLRDKAMHSLGIGTMHDMHSVLSGIFLASLRSRDYTMAEKVKLWRGKLFSDRFMWNEMLSTDLTQQVTELRLPVYFLHGRLDFTVSYAEARSYLNAIDAPLKGFYTFEHSAHSPVFEEPERLREIVQRDVVPGAIGLADAEGAQDGSPST